MFSASTYSNGKSKAVDKGDDQLSKILFKIPNNVNCFLIRCCLCIDNSYPYTCLQVSQSFVSLVNTGNCYRVLLKIMITFTDLHESLNLRYYSNYVNYPNYVYDL